MNKLVMRAAVAALAAVAVVSPASAQVAAAEIKPGMQVYDARKGLVGAVSKVDGGLATVVTDKHAIALNPGSFTLDHGSLLFGMTRAELNAYYEANIMAADQSLLPGKPIKGLGGASLGTIKAIDSAKVVVTLASGQNIELPRNAVVGAADGAVAGVSVEEIQNQLAVPAAPAAPTAPSAPAGSANAAS